MNIQRHRFFLLVVFSTLALVGKSQIKTGFKVGIGLTDQYQKRISYQLNTKNKVAFNLGMVAEKALNKNFSISTEINYAVKGYKSVVFIDRFVSPTDPDTLSSFNSILHYLEIPINFVARITFQNKHKIAMGAGPYVAYGIAGKNKLDYDKSSYDPFKSGDQRIDLGGNVFLAYEVSRIKISLSYSDGFTDISGDDDSFIIKNRYGGLNIGYYFGQL